MLFEFEHEYTIEELNRELFSQLVDNGENFLLDDENKPVAYMIDAGNDRSVNFSDDITRLDRCDFYDIPFLIFTKEIDIVIFRGLYKLTDNNSSPAIVFVAKEAESEGNTLRATESILFPQTNNDNYWWMNARHTDWGGITSKEYLCGQIQCYDLNHINKDRNYRDIRSGDLVALKYTRGGKYNQIDCIFVVVCCWNEHIYISKKEDINPPVAVKMIKKIRKEQPNRLSNVFAVNGNLKQGSLYKISGDDFEWLTNTSLSNDKLIDNGYVTDCKLFNYEGAKGSQGVNRIYYGTPGCGKSHYLKYRLLTEFKNENIVRTVFHQEYTNTDFIGQILPVINYEENNRLEYKFMPGPFTDALVKAYENPTEKIALVIEELNRGNATTIFGEMLQLLDRYDEDGREGDENYPAGTSEYGITCFQIQNYLKNTNDNEFSWDYSNLNEIRIPSNLYIFATMNTSDQNVFTMDTAFKRRWDFEKISNNFSDDDTIRNKYIPGLSITWQSFVERLNNFMRDDASVFSEDRFIGKYFISTNDLCDHPRDINIEKKRKFAHKVLEYLWSDVSRLDRKRWFNADIKTIDDLFRSWESNNCENIFSNDLRGRLMENAD